MPHRDQLLVAFQAQDLLFTGLPGIGEVLGQADDEQRIAGGEIGERARRGQRK